MKVKSESEVSQSGPTLSNPMDCSLPGSSIHGIFQARVLEWGAIALSNISLYNYLLMECTVLRVKPNINYESGVIMIFQCRFTDCNKCTTWVRNGDNGGI